MINDEILTRVYCGLINTWRVDDVDGLIKDIKDLILENAALKEKVKILEAIHGIVNIVADSALNNMIELEIMQTASFQDKIERRRL